jgi:tetratricopeptide (TPR) repeat protein
MRRITRVLLSPVLFARRRPVAALTLIAVFLLAALLLSWFGIYLWSNFHMRAARREVESGHNFIAAVHLRHVFWARSDHPEALLLAARVARRRGETDNAEEFLNRRAKSHGEDEDSVLERLLLQASRGELEEVRGLLQLRIDRSGPAGDLAREAMIEGLLQNFMTDVARTRIEDWLDKDPTNAIALLLLGKMHERREKPSEALLAYRKLVELDPANHEARLRVTTLLLQLSQADEAMPHLEYLKEHLPDHPAVPTQIGQALSLQGHTDEARVVLDECLKRFPNYPAALAERGKIERQYGDTLKAEEYLGRAVRLDPANTTARYHYYLALNKNGKTEEAKKQQEIIRQMEDDIHRIGDIVNVEMRDRSNEPALLYEVAMIAQRAGRRAEAIQWLNRALQAAPNHLPSHRALVGLYYDMGNPILSARHRAIAQQLGK